MYNEFLQDIIARFGKQEAMPREFFTDFVKVAQDERRHFSLLAARLEELGSYYGALPAHDGLWDSATSTSEDLLSRLAVEHCVHEVCLTLVLSAIAIFGCLWFCFMFMMNLMQLTSLDN